MSHFEKLWWTVLSLHLSYSFGLSAAEEGWWEWVLPAALWGAFALVSIFMLGRWSVKRKQQKEEWRR